MPEISRFLARRRQASIVHLIRDVAAQCQAEVWDRVRNRIFEMGLVEARGYVRARAQAVVRVRLDREFSLRRIHRADQEQISAIVRERVVHLLISDLVAGSSAGRRMAA